MTSQHPWVCFVNHNALPLIEHGSPAPTLQRHSPLSSSQVGLYVGVVELHCVRAVVYGVV